jgi:hypothetical protein
MQPITHATTDNEDEEANNNNNNNNNFDDIVTNDDDEPVTTRSGGGAVAVGCRLTVGMVLLVIFVASLVWQFNDSGAAVSWALFYFLHALLAGIGIVRHFGCRAALPPKILLGVTAVSAMWSIVLMGISGANLANTASGGQDAGGDNPNATAREEQAYELGGAFLGLASAVFHATLFGGMCCFKNI